MRLRVFTLRNKLLVFAVALALVPLGLAGRTMIRITRDELKSKANDEISQTVKELATTVDDLYGDTWLAPLLLVASSVDDPRLGGDQKLSMLQASIQNLPDVVSCQVSVVGIPGPIVVSRTEFSDALTAEGAAPAEVLTIPGERVAEVTADHPGEVWAGDPVWIEATGDWLLTVLIPLENPLAGRQAVLGARLDLARVRSLVEDHPFAVHGRILAVDTEGRRLFDPTRQDLSGLAVVAEAMELLRTSSRAVGVRPYTRPDGEAMIAAYGFPSSFPWAFVVERSESEAYRAVTRMADTFNKSILGGLALAVLAAFLIATRISRPVEKIAATAREVGRGNLDAEVEGVKSRDEIGALARRMNDMIRGLRERDFLRETFGRYMSPAVAQRILSDPEALHPGGDLKTVTVLMSDLRGFTSLSESYSPAEMVELLNAYLAAMSEVVDRHRGIVVEFIGDAIMALFGALETLEDDAERAVACAAEMQIAMEAFNERSRADGMPDLEMGIGLSTGPVVVGNIGSEKRMKYGVVGDCVNLAARIESFTVGGEVLVSAATREVAAGVGEFRGPIAVRAKGKKEPLQMFAVVSVGEPYDLRVPAEHRTNTDLVAADLTATAQRIVGTRVDDERMSLHIRRIGRDGADVEGAVEVDLFDNLRLALELPDGSLPDVYAKVVAKDGKRTRLRFTSIPDAELDRFKDHLSQLVS